MNSIQQLSGVDPNEEVNTLGTRISDYFRDNVTVENAGLPYGFLLPQTEANLANIQSMVETYFDATLRNSKFVKVYADVLMDLRKRTTKKLRANYGKLNKRVFDIALQYVVPVLPYFTFCLRFTRGKRLQCDYFYIRSDPTLTDDFVKQYIHDFATRFKAVVQEQQKINMEDIKNNRDIILEKVHPLALIIGLSLHKTIFSAYTMNTTYSPNVFEPDRLPLSIASPSLTLQQMTLANQVWTNYQHYDVATAVVVPTQ